MIYFLTSCSQDLFLHQKTSQQFRRNQLRTSKILDFREDFNEVFKPASVFRLVWTIQRNFISTKSASVFIFISLNVQCMKSIQNSHCSRSCLIFIGASLWGHRWAMNPRSLLNRYLWWSHITKDHTGPAHLITSKEWGARRSDGSKTQELHQSNTCGCPNVE